MWLYGVFIYKSLGMHKNLFLLLIYTLITVSSFSQQKPTRGYYNDKDMRDLLDEFIAKRMPELENQIFAKDPKIDEYTKSNKFYSKEKEHPVDRYMFADECKIIHLEKINDSTIFYGQPVKLLEINKNKAVIELPKTLYKKVKKYKQLV